MLTIAQHQPASGEKLARTLSAIIMISTILHSVPPTSILGAILAASYLTGAMASHWRAAGALFTQILFGCYLALILFGALWLRDRNLCGLLPGRRQHCLSS